MTLHEVLQIAYEIPGQTWPSELHWIYGEIERRVKDRQDYQHVEIGSYCGRSLWVTAAAIKSGTIISVENLLEAHDPQWASDVLTSTIQLIHRHFPHVIIHVSNKNSLEASHDITKKLDSIFIDACHAYAECRADIEVWSTQLKESGLLFGHDYWPAHVGVMDAVNYCLTGQFEVIPNTRIWKADV